MGLNDYKVISVTSRDSTRKKLSAQIGICFHTNDSHLPSGVESTLERLMSGAAMRRKKPYMQIFSDGAGQWYHATLRLQCHSHYPMHSSDMAMQ